MNESLRRTSTHVFVDDILSPMLDSDDAHHLSRVLRLRDGQVVSASDGKGAWRMCEWREGGIVPTGDVSVEAAPLPSLTVALAPVKGDRTDDAIEKLVEIGIDTIIVLAPLDRSVVRWDSDRAESAISRYRRIARAASSQSRRVHLPRIMGPTPLAEVLTVPDAAIAEPGGTTEFSDVTTVVIGPEGGFSADEAAAALRKVDLGSGILRADTAAVVAATRMVAHWRR